MDDEQRQQDSLTLGSAVNGGCVKIYFNYNSETKESIEQKAEFAQDLQLKLEIRNRRLKGA